MKLRGFSQRENNTLTKMKKSLTVLIVKLAEAIVKIKTDEDDFDDNNISEDFRSGRTTDEILTMYKHVTMNHKEGLNEITTDNIFKM